MNNPFETIDTRLSNIENLLLDLKQNDGLTNKLSEAEQLLTIKDAATFLSLSVPTLYGLVSQSKIPVSKQGKRLYFSKPELIEWIKSGRKKTIFELEIQANTYFKKKKADKI